VEDEDVVKDHVAGLNGYRHGAVAVEAGLGEVEPQLSRQKVRPLVRARHHPQAVAQVRIRSIQVEAHIDRRRIEPNALGRSVSMPSDRNAVAFHLKHQRVPSRNKVHSFEKLLHTTKNEGMAHQLNTCMRLGKGVFDAKRNTTLNALLISLCTNQSSRTLLPTMSLIPSGGHFVIVPIIRIIALQTL